MKKAYEHCTEGSNPGGKVLSRTLNTAVTAGKRVRAETAISKGAVSISSAAAQFSAIKLPQDCQKSIDEARLTIIGAGKMARLLLVHLQSQGVKALTVLNRSPERVKDLQVEFPDMMINYRPMEDIWKVVVESDVVFPCTTSNTTIIDPIPLQEALKQRNSQSCSQSNGTESGLGSTSGSARAAGGGGGLQFIDISVPRNVHPDCGKIPGVFNYNVDFLKATVERNTALRKREFIEAENILKEELNKHISWQFSLFAVPTITKLKNKLETIRQEEIKRAMKHFTNNNNHENKHEKTCGHEISPESINENVLEKFSKLLIAKLLHGPMTHLRQQKEGGEATINAVKHIQMAFQLDQ